MSAEATVRAGSREWVGLAVLALACVVYAMDLTVLHLAVPTLSEDLQPTSTQLLWIIDIYGFMVAGALITMGTLGDRIGRRRLLLIGAVAFGLSSLLAAFSTSSEMLIASRALLGIAGATHRALDAVAHTQHVPGRGTANVRDRRLDHGVLARWRDRPPGRRCAARVLLVGLGLPAGRSRHGAASRAGAVLLPEYRDPGAGRLDLLSAALSLVSVLAVVYGLKQMVQDGLGSAPPIVSIALGLVVGLVFVRRQMKLADPLIDLRLFRARAFSASLAVYTLGILVVFGAFFFIFQYLQLVAGLSPFEAGLVTLPSFAAFVVGSMLAPALAKRARPAYVMAGGLLIGAFGFALMTQVGVDSSLAVLVTSSVLFSLGLAPVFTLTNDLIIGTAPPEKAGAASGISETGAELGGALSIAILGTIGTAVYRSQVADNIPGSVPPDQADTARDTLGGAVAASEGLSESLGTELLDVARDAFTQSLQVAAVVSAVLAAGTAVVAAIFLRQVRGGSATEAEGELAPSVTGAATTQRAT